MVKLTNTLTRKKEEFKPLKEGYVGYYSCGPTVYNYVHIGNLRTYIFTDTLKRVLQYNGYTVNHVMNITDVGHLTSDADSGEDKMLKGAQREKKTVWEIADFYTRAFQDNIHDLNIGDPTIWCKATDHILEQIELIKKLEKKGFAYLTGGNVYFDTSKFSRYGTLAQLNLSATQEARVEKDANKKNPHDFVLWFTKSKFGDQDMKWESPWGVGYPGWHIECSAMSTKYLGQPFDIHSGGVDHISVHHTNEIAQSEAAAGVPLARYWIHGEFLVINEKRMGKSEENFITLQVLKEKGYQPLTYRFFCLQAHYRQQLQFTWEALTAAQEGFLRLTDNITRIHEIASRAGETTDSVPPSFAKQLKSATDEFTESINDDLNTPRALAALHELLSSFNSDFPNPAPHECRALIAAVESYDTVLRLQLITNVQTYIPGNVTKYHALREHARAEKKWEESDRLRLLIEAEGYEVRDSSGGSSLVKKRR